MPKTSTHQRPARTEVEAYDYIRRQLRDLGWLVKNPSLGSGGQVWTQNQCLRHPDMKKAWVLDRPENVVKVNERVVWVIEAKADRKDLTVAVNEATDFYSARLNGEKRDLQATFATGIAGDEELGYIARTSIFLKGRWRVVTINGKEATGLLSQDDLRSLLDSQGSDIHEFAPPQWLFLQAAERINEILHEGGINKNDRAKTMAALLLSVVDEPPNLNTRLPVLIGEINARSQAILTENGKPDFAPFVRILPPTNTTNHVKFKAALIKTIQELLNLNIRSAMNSSTDVLGQFYEVFLKYGNGAKEIGIVLTPRHITRFGVDALGVSPNDLVLDPACGTGGFLVAAFDTVRRNGTKAQLGRFKKFGLFGIEEGSAIAALAIVNMIFRGDGKNNIVEGNCFSTNLTPRTIEGSQSAAYTREPPKAGNEPITRVLMNPPFALKGAPDKEYKFVSRALEFMADGGLLFALLPMDCMFGSRQEKVWRSTELLTKHTLLAVISLPDELFYPAAMKQVVAVVIRKGFPHGKTRSVFWGRIAEDGQVKVKSRRMDGADFRPPRPAGNDIPEVLPLLRRFIVNPETESVNHPMLCKTSPVNFSDPLLELLPEVYLDSVQPSVAELRADIERMTRETAALLIRQGREDQAEVLSD